MEPSTLPVGLNGDNGEMIEHNVSKKLVPFSSVRDLNLLANPIHHPVVLLAAEGTSVVLEGGVWGRVVLILAIA